MTNVVNITDTMSVTTDTSAVLDRVLVDIANTATGMVEGAYTIGTLLLEAKEVIGDDIEFGKWRDENVCSTFGISRRTCARMQNIAETFSKKDLPAISVSVLYTICSDSVAPNLQDALIERARIGAEAGKPLTARETGRIASRVSQGRMNYIDVKRETAKIADEAKLDVKVDIPGQAEAAAAEDEQEERAARADNRVPRRRVPAPNAPPAPDAVEGADEWAAKVVRQLRGVSKENRNLFLFALKAKMEKSKMLDIEGDLQVQVTGGAMKVRTDTDS